MQDLFAVGNLGGYNLVLDSSEKRLFIWGQTIESDLYIPNMMKVFSFDEKIVSVGSGSLNILIQTESKRMFGFGVNTEGQISTESNGIKLENGLIELNYNKIFSNGFNKISCGRYHSIVVTEKGELFTWGSNDNNQCGPTGKLVSVPTLVEFPDKITIIQASGGGYHTLCLSNEGLAFSFGGNSNGECGIATNSRIIKYVEKPTLIKHDNPIIKVQCGWFHSLFLNKKGEIYSFGMSVYGQLGFKIEEGAVISTPTKIEAFNGKKMTTIGASNHASYAFTEDKKLFGFGSNTQKQLSPLDSPIIFEPIDLQESFSVLNELEILEVSCHAHHIILKTEKNGNIDFISIGLSIDDNIIDVVEKYKPRSILDVIRSNKIEEPKFFSYFVKREWNIENHHLFPFSTRKCIETIFIVFSIKKRNNEIFIPKFVLFLIVKQFVEIDGTSFSSSFSPPPHSSSTDTSNKKHCAIC